MRILVVSADDDRVAWIEWALLDENVELWLARSGEEGAAFSKSGKFALILVDPDLPDMSGPKLLRIHEVSGSIPLGSTNERHITLHLDSTSDRISRICH